MYRILIVEDDAVIANAVQKHLVSWGYEARIAEDFENVLPAFAQYAPQLVLMDISLPFFNGYHWCSEIRKISKVPVIFITSMTKSEVKSTIHSQVLIVFFLPLAACIVHLGFAFPMIRRILQMFSLTNVGLFAGCTLCAIAVFAVLYTLVYVLTAKTYYRIVS